MPLESFHGNFTFPMAHQMVIEPLHASLRTWGSKLNLSVALPLGVGSHGGSNIAVHRLKAEPISFDVHFRSTGSGDLTTLLVNVAFVLVCLAALFICLQMSGDSDPDGSEDGPPSRTKKANSLADVQRRARAEEGGPVQVQGPGSWAQAYREAKGDKKEALELLFRCHIISTYEFAESSVNQEHIDECILIGLQMLRLKPLKDWVSIRYQAKQVFEDSTAAAFCARSDRSRSATPRDPLSTCSSLTDSYMGTPNGSPTITGLPHHDTQWRATQYPRMDYPSIIERQQMNTPWPSVQTPHVDHRNTQSRSAMDGVASSSRDPHNFSIPEPQKKLTLGPAVQIPRMDLQSLSSARDQSSGTLSGGPDQSYREDDDDPYTTRDRTKTVDLAIKVPSMDLHSLRIARGEPSLVDDDDPYTTRNHF